MKYGLALLALVSLLTTEPLISQVPVPQTVVNHIYAINLLDASYSAADRIDLADRVYYLTYATPIAADIDTHRTKAWCNELFSRAFQMPPGHDRVATEKNALMQISKIDAQSALDLLPLVEEPQPDPMGDFPEDVRSDAAITIFVNFWNTCKGKNNGTSPLSCMEQIRPVAQHLEDTGEYPYRAMGKVLAEVEKSPDALPRTEINRVLEEGIRSYQRPSEIKFQNRREEFLQLLQNTITLVSGDLYKQALHIFVSDITANTASPEGSFSSVIDTVSELQVKFENRNKAFLFRAFPLIAQVDGEWAQDLVSVDPELAKAERGITRVRSSVVLGTPTKEQATQAHAEMLQRTEIQAIKSSGFVNLQATLKSVEKAQAAQNPGIRIEYLTTLLAVAVQSNSPSVDVIYRAVKAEMNNLQGSEKLTAMVGLVKSNFYPPQSKEFSDLVSDILKQGAEMFEQKPTIRPNRRPGFSALADATDFMASSGQDWFIDRVQKLDNPVLKAYLLVNAAKGAAEPRKKYIFPAPTEAANLK